MACVTKLYPGTMLAMLPDCAVWFDGGLIIIYPAAGHQRANYISHFTHTQPICFWKYLHKRSTDLGKIYHMELWCLVWCLWRSLWYNKVINYSVIIDYLPLFEDQFRVFRRKTLTPSTLGDNSYGIQSLIIYTVPFISTTAPNSKFWPPPKYLKRVIFKIRTTLPPPKDLINKYWN